MLEKTKENFQALMETIEFDKMRKTNLYVGFGVLALFANIDKSYLTTIRG